jgi:hypothetical protein
LIHARIKAFKKGVNGVVESEFSPINVEGPVVEQRPKSMEAPKVKRLEGSKAI